MVGVFVELHSNGPAYPCWSGNFEPTYSYSARDSKSGVCSDAECPDPPVHLHPWGLIYERSESKIDSCEGRCYFHSFFKNGMLMCSESCIAFRTRNRSTCYGRSAKTARMQQCPCLSRPDTLEYNGCLTQRETLRQHISGSETLCL